MEKGLVAVPGSWRSSGRYFRLKGQLSYADLRIKRDGSGGR